MPDTKPQPDAPAPGPDDVVTVTVGGKGTHGRVTTKVERGAGAETHPDGSRAVPDQDSPTL